MVPQQLRVLQEEDAEVPGRRLRKRNKNKDTQGRRHDPKTAGNRKNTTTTLNIEGTAQQIEDQIKGIKWLDFVETEIARDGNCFFKSIIEAVKLPSHLHLDLRA